jgi:RNA polymerase sigma factor (sigma-70 family)
MQSDSEAIVASLGDPHAFGVVFERHFTAIHGYLQRRLDDRRADEATAQTFLIAFDRRGRFDRRRDDARPWLFGIATNVAHGERRHELRELRAIAAMAPERGDAVEGVESRLDAENVRGALARGLAELPREEADVVGLLVWGELRQPEIADALEIPLGTVKSRLSRARGRLRSALGADADKFPLNPTQTGGRPWTS